MSEAYEIGVTLALGDGVSAGIAQARRDTAQLERVLQAGGVSVQQLRAASVVALSAIRTVPAVERAVTKEPALSQREESAPAVTERTQTTPAVAERTQTAPAVARVEAAPAPAPAPASAWPQVSEAAMQPKVTAPPIVAPQQGPVAIAAVVPERADSPVLVASSAPGVAPRSEPGLQAVQTPQVTPAVVPQSVFQVSAPISLAAIGAAAREERPTPAPVSLASEPTRSVAVSPADAPFSAMPALQAPDTGGAVGTAPRAWEPAVESAWAMPGGDGATGMAGGMTAGPLPPATAPERAPVGSQGATEAGATVQAPAAPPSAAANPQPTEGDVYLDGALVGRWISRFLTQEAGRASAGPTGFDPRRGRVLPGATVGG